MKKLGMHTADIVCENILKIKELFPNCIKEFKDSNGELKFGIDFEMLKQELSDEIIESDEKYEFNWPGKKNAILISNSPTNKTLRPCKEESVNWDTTQNLYLEGDNLEILKILRSTYLNKIKIIYIDPPYNTGKDYIYKDDFKESVSEYLAATGQIDDEGNRLFQNKETNGRFHTDWLNMIYPRLKLARDLLSDDEVIFISIDDHEVHNLRKICDDIFGEENYIGIVSIINNLKGRSDSKFLAKSNDFSIVYAKNISQFVMGGFKLTNEKQEEYKFSDDISNYKEVPLRKTGKNSRKIDRPNMYYPIYYDNKCNTFSLEYNKNLIEIFPTDSQGNPGCWRWGKSTFEKNKDTELTVKKNNNKYNIYVKMRDQINGERRTLKPKTIWLDSNFDTGHSNLTLRKLFDNQTIFDNPKPVDLIKNIIECGILSNFSNESIVLDFFSGSATTAHAVMQLNAEDGGNRKFIMVQLPEPCNEKSEAFKAGYKNICEIGKERIRRAGKKIIEETGKTDLDIGFRVFKLDSSNMEDTYYLPQEYNLSLIKNKKLYENIKKDRTQEDLLFQVMLQKDFPLSAQIKEEIIDDKRVFSVDGNNLICCFEDNLTEDLITKIISQKLPRIFVTRNNSIDDNVLTNISPIIQVYSPETELEVI